MISSTPAAARLSLFVLFGALSLAVPRESAAQQERTAQAPPRFMAIEQGGKVVPQKDGEVRLERAPFTIVLALPTAGTVMARASRDSRVFDLARSGQSLLGPFGEGGGLAEGLRNGDESVFLIDNADEPAYHYWFYESKTVHRFDSVEDWSHGILGRRTVSRFSARGETMRTVETFPASTVYFVFRLVNAAKAEVSRAAIRVTFADDPRPQSGQSGPGVVATVGDRAIRVGTFRQAYEVALQSYRATYGERTREEFRGLGVHLQVLQRLVDEQVTLLEGERLGVNVSDEQTMARIKSLPLFQSAGKFVGAKRYEEILRAQRPSLTEEDLIYSVRFSLIEQALLERLRLRTGADADKPGAYRAYLDSARGAMRVIVSPDVIARVIDAVK